MSFVYCVCEATPKSRIAKNEKKIYEKKYYYYYPSDGSFRQVNFTFSKFGIGEKKSFFEKALSHPGVPIPTYSYLGTLMENQSFFFFLVPTSKVIKKIYKQS